MRQDYQSGAFYWVFGYEKTEGGFIPIAGANEVIPSSSDYRSSPAPVASEEPSPVFSPLLFSPQIPSPLPSPNIPARDVIEYNPQGQLAQAPSQIRAVYLTGWSGGSPTKIEYAKNLARSGEINAVVIDVKDFSGTISYDTNVQTAQLYGAEQKRIRDIEGVIRGFHEANMYAIARITVFQDPILAKARPDLGVQSRSNLLEKNEEWVQEKPAFSVETLWLDRNELAWIDPAAKEYWEYVGALAKDAVSRGFDEINFDYIRFPSDGDMQDMTFPFWNEISPRREILSEFFAYLRETLPDTPISADLFGLTTINRDDLGIGQVIEDAYGYFDYIAPMVYPSHYADGFKGYANPAEYPYEVVQYSMQTAVERLRHYRFLYPERKIAKLRPWLQDFDLGANYDKVMVQAEIEATKQALGEDYAGYMIWNPSNIYTTDALQGTPFDAAAYQLRKKK